MKHAFYFASMLWRDQRRWLLMGAAASLLALLSAIALLALSGWFITAAGIAGITGAGIAFDFFRPSAGIRFLALLRTAARYGERLATHDGTLRFFASLRANLFRAVAKAPATNSRLGSGGLLQRLTSDLESVDTLYLRVLLPAGVAIAVGILLCIVLIQLSVSFAIAVGVAFLTSLFALWIGAFAAKKPARRIALGTEALRVRTIDLVHAQTDLLFSGSLGAQQDRVSKAARYLSDAGNRLVRIEIAGSIGIALAGVGLTLAFILLGGAAFEARAIDGPVMALLVIGGFAALEVFAPLRRGAVELGRIAFSSKRLYALSTSAPERDHRVLAGKGPAVAVLGMTFRHGADAKPILDNFSFAARKSERVVLVGGSGCGKSSLLWLIAGLLQPERGNILIQEDGSTRPALGLLTQRTELFRGSIADNLRIAAPEASDRELWQALQVVELREKVETLNGTLSWQLGESGNGFSGGEQRRLALARLVLRSPQIWLLDEPTAGMDEALAQRVLANLLRYASGSAWIIAAHHDREIALAHRVVRLDAPGAA